MKWLFLYAHPDDETVGAGGTIRMLVDLGHKVRVVLATDGTGGDMQRGRLGNKRLGDLRRREFEKACRKLGVGDYQIMDFVDGRITNEIVWSGLESAFKKEIEGYKPDAVVTFDHSGWYFHLDHIGVSVAATRAMNDVKDKVQLFMFCLFSYPGIKKKWPYVYPEKLPFTHRVDISEVVREKVSALQAHKSQGMRLASLLKIPKVAEKLGVSWEYFQMVSSSKKGRKMLDEIGIFEEIV